MLITRKEKYFFKNNTQDLELGIKLYSENDNLYHFIFKELARIRTK